MTATPSQRRAALAALTVMGVLAAARPPALRLRAAFALLVLGGIALLAARLVPKRDLAADVVGVPSGRAPGEDPSLVGGLWAATTDASFRIFGGACVALLVVWNIVLRPMDVHASVLGQNRTFSCGVRQYLFGAGDGGATAACRSAYGGRAAAGFVVLAALGVAVSMMGWIVQYYRGAALGAVWHRDGVPTAFVARAGGACAVLTAVALLAAGGGALVTRSRAELASMPTSPPSGAPLADEVTPQPTFAVEHTIPPPVVPSRAVVDNDHGNPSEPTTVATTEPPSAETPLALHDASWYAARPSLETVSVPEGSLPVGATAGDDDMHAFVRLSGTASTLTLVEASDPGSERFADQATIALCPVKTADWKQTSGGSFAEQPAYDETACVNAKRATDGTWTVDLSNFQDRGGNRGFALIPVVDASGATFRVTLVEHEPDGSS